MKSRREKIEALLNSPIEGERLAAAAALDRVRPPAKGSEEWTLAVRDWNRKIEWAVSRLGSHVLSDGEIRTIRNFYRYRGTPWSRGSGAFTAVLHKLETAENRGKKGAFIPHSR